MQKKHLNPSTTLSRIAHFIALLLLCTAFVLGTSGIASSAEEAADESDYVLEDTVVTATKTGETLLQKTGIAISAFDDDMIRTRSSFRLDDLATFSPNVEILDNFYYIRGIGNTADWSNVEAQVSVYLDGVFLPRGLGSQTDLVDVERVEILRGPQGTLYGQNSTGGSINIIYKKPTGELEGRVGLEIASFSKFRLDGTISGPIVKDKVNGRFTFKAQTNEGFLDVVEGPATDQDAESLVFRGVLDFIFNENCNLLLRADYQDDEANGINGKIIDATGSLHEAFGYVSPPGFYDVGRNYDSSAKIETWGISADLNWQLPFGTLKSLTAYRYYEGDDSFDADVSALELWRDQEIEEHSWYSQEIQLNGSINRLNWIVGAYYFHHDEEVDVWFRLPDFIVPFTLTMDGDYEASTYAAFAHVDYQLTDQLKLSVGVRYSYSERDIWFVDNYDFFPFPVIDQGDWSSFVPKFQAEYQMTDDAMLYATIGQGFRAGTVDPINPIAGLPGEVDEETVWNYEIGIKSDWLNKRLRVNAAAFYMDYTDMVQDYFTTVGGIIQNVVGNASEAEISGFEIEVLAMPMPALTLHLSAGLLDTELTDFRDARDSAGNLLDASGNELLRAPELTYSLGAQYIFTLGEFGFLTVRGDLNLRGEQFPDIQNDPRFELDEVTLLNAFVRFETADTRWSIDGYARNLTDEEYYSGKREFSFGGTIGNQAPPATFGARITYNF